MRIRAEPVPCSHLSSRLLACVLVFCVIGCGAGRVQPGEPAPYGAAVSVEFTPARDLLISPSEGDTMQIAAVQQVLGLVRHHDADSLVLAVSSLRSDTGTAKFADARLHIAEPGTARVTVLSEHPTVVNVFFILLIPAFFVALIVSLSAM
jgi:hypothetical protein